MKNIDGGWLEHSRDCDGDGVLRAPGRPLLRASVPAGCVGGKVASQGVQSALAAFALVATLNADKLRSATNAPPREV